MNIYSIEDVSKDVDKNKKEEGLKLTKKHTKKIVTAENTEIVMSYLDSIDDVEAKEEDIEDSIKTMAIQKEKLKKLAITDAEQNIKLNKRNESIKDNKEKLEKILKKIDGYSLEELEKWHKEVYEPSKEMKTFIRNTTNSVANAFLKSYNDTKDTLIITKNWDNFVKSKSKKVIYDHIKQSEQFKKFQSKLFRHHSRTDKNKTPSFLSSLLDYYAKIPNKIMQQAFKVSLANRCKKDLKDRQTMVLDTIVKNLEPSKNKDNER